MGKHTDRRGTWAALAAAFVALAIMGWQYAALKHAESACAGHLVVTPNQPPVCK